MQLNQDHEGSLLYETVTTKIIFGLFFQFLYMFIWTVRLPVYFVSSYCVLTEWSNQK